MQDVTAGSPGDRAGLRPYDLIVASTARPARRNDELIRERRRPARPAARRAARRRARRPAGRRHGEARRAAGPRRGRRRRRPGPRAVDRPRSAEHGRAGRHASSIARSRDALQGCRAVATASSITRVEPMSSAFDADIERGTCCSKSTGSASPPSADFDALTGARSRRRARRLSLQPGARPAHAARRPRSTRRDAWPYTCQLASGPRACRTADRVRDASTLHEIAHPGHRRRSRDPRLVADDPRIRGLRVRRRRDGPGGPRAGRARGARPRVPRHQDAGHGRPRGAAAAARGQRDAAGRDDLRPRHGDAPRSRRPSWARSTSSRSRSPASACSSPIRNALDRSRLRDENRSLKRAVEVRHQIVGDSAALQAGDRRRARAPRRPTRPC